MRSKKLNTGWRKISLGITQTENAPTFHVQKEYLLYHVTYLIFNVTHCHKMLSYIVLIANCSVFYQLLVSPSVLAP